MKITRRNIDKNKDICYVVTRQGRRIEDRNYRTEYGAQERAERLRKMLKEYDPLQASSIGIVCTSEPRKIF